MRSQRAAVLLSCLCAAASACAESPFEGDDLVYQATPIEQRLADLEARLAEYESQQAGVTPASACLGGCDAAPACRPCACRDPWSRPCGGLFADAELLMLQYADTDGDDRNDSLESGSRYTLGYLDHDGRGFRARYFEFNSDDQTGPGVLDIETLDLEYLSRFRLGRNWVGDLSLGARWLSLANPTPRNYEDAWGPVVGVSLRDDLCDWLALYGGARHSILIGDERNDNGKKTVSASELNLGVELSADTRAVEMFVRTGVEAQLYSSVRDDEEDYGLIGWTLAVGVRR